MIKRLLILMIVVVISTAVVLYTRTDRKHITVESFSYEGGVANLIADNVAITALHCVINPNDILYKDDDRDVAIIQTDRRFSEVAVTYNLKLSKEPSMHTDVSILPGDSGQIYIENDTVYGIKLGYNSDGGLVATITEDLYKIMCKYIERNDVDE